MVTVTVYVEGGGDARRQRSPLREGFKTLLEGFTEGGRRVLQNRIKIIACGSRREAFEDFCRHATPGPHVLLVDSEDPIVDGEARWTHVKRRDGWDRPAGVDDPHLHFMVCTMEAWICADPDALSNCFGDGFNAKKLPQRRDLEAVPKRDLARQLSQATSASRRGEYRKGRDLALVGRLDPVKVVARCPHAGVLFEALKRLAEG